MRVDVKPESCKWIEINIFFDDNQKKKLFEETRTLVDGPDINWVSWHFFFEPAMRLRFLVPEDQVSYVKLILNHWADIEGYRHLFGRHGREGLEYVGEAEIWGSDWPAAYKMFEAGSEYALRTEFIGSTSNSWRAERASHLFLNQLGYDWSDEAVFHAKMHQGIIYTLGSVDRSTYPRADWEKQADIDAMKKQKAVRRSKKK